MAIHPIPAPYTADFPRTDLSRLQLTVYEARRALADAGLLDTPHLLWDAIYESETLLLGRSARTDAIRYMQCQLVVLIEDLQPSCVRFGWFWSCDNDFIRERRLIEGEQAIAQAAENPNFICWI